MILENVVAVGKETEIHQLAAQVGKQVFAADDINEALEITARVHPDLIFCDQRFGNENICNFFENVTRNSSVAFVVVNSDEGTMHNGESFLQIGAHYYLRGKQDYNQFPEIAKQIKSQLKNCTLTSNIDNFFVDDLAASVSMVGQSEAVKYTLKMIKTVASSQCNPVLIIGETGTGKEVAAKAIHTLRHPNERFVAVNCAALTANLLESELFGHVKGAFTGADSDKTGLLELAGEGTVFLDEITEMPMDLQAKLLRVLQEKTFRKVGGTKEIVCKATIIASSNRNLKNEVNANRIRSDLYYRLNIFPVILAPLRSPQRQDDIPLLVEYFLKTLSANCEGKKIPTLTKIAMEVLQKHDWPGNVRELRNVIERAILLEITDKIGLSSIVIDPIEFRWFADTARTAQIKDFSLAKAEQELIVKALHAVNGQKTQAAELLGISRATLYAKVKQYGIHDAASESLTITERTGELVPA